MPMPVTYFKVRYKTRSGEDRTANSEYVGGIIDDPEFLRAWAQDRQICGAKTTVTGIEIVGDSEKIARMKESRPALPSGVADALATAEGETVQTAEPASPQG